MDDFGYAHFCLQKLRILPSEFAGMSMEEKAFIVASIQVRIENEREQEKKLKEKKVK